MPFLFATLVRRLASARRVSATAAFLLLVSLAPAARARTIQHHKHRIHAMTPLLADVDLPSIGLISGDDDEVPVDGQQYELKLARRGGDIVDVIYRVGDTYIPQALDTLSNFLRDSHNDEVRTYDPRTFDILHTMLRKLDRSNSVIEILCGYRTKETNDALRKTGRTNAAKHSEHIEANALDFRVPGVPAVQLRDAALSVGAGGVGYYPRGQFVHVDTGPVRKWTFSAHRRRHKRHTHHP